MTPTYFHCLICNTPCQPLHENKDDQTTTVDGMFIRAHGNYGSTHFDPLSHDQYLEAVICNLCTIAKHTHFRRYHQGRLAPWHPTIANRPIIPTSTATFHHNPLTPTKDQPHTFTITPNPTPQEAHHILLHSHAIKTTSPKASPQKPEDHTPSTPSSSTTSPSADSPTPTTTPSPAATTSATPPSCHPPQSSPTRPHAPTQPSIIASTTANPPPQNTRTT
jgi:hypothetical protein